MTPAPVRSRVVCVGDLMVDVVAQLGEALHTGSDTPAAVTWRGGGSAANTAAWLAAAGIPVTFVGRVGDDIPGWAAVDDLARLGVDACVAVDRERPTGTCVVLVDAQRERSMIPSAGANAALAAADVDAADLPAATHLHVSGYALFGGGRAAALHALQRAREHGLSVSVGAASRAPLEAVGAAAFLDWALGSTVFANRDEATALVSAGSVADQAAALARAVSGAAVVTAGAGEAVWSDGSGAVTVAPGAVEILDPTGAGDAFAAGFLAATLAGAPPSVALAAAHRTAAAAVGLVGGRPDRPISAGK